MTNSRRKGHDFERRVANGMREELGEVVKEDVKESSTSRRSRMEISRYMTS